MKNDRWTSRVSGVLMGAAALMVASGAAWAQDAPLRPPTPQGLKGPVTVLTIIVTVVLAGLLLLAAFFPSRRGHQD